MSLVWSPDIRNFQCTILSYFEAFLMKLFKYILSTSNTTKNFDSKTQRILVFKATRLLALREYVVLRVSVPEIFSHWMNQEMTQLSFAGYPKMFVLNFHRQLNCPNWPDSRITIVCNQTGKVGQFGLETVN